jgi:hypothetical protein
LAQQGKVSEAETLAIAAADRRPHSYRVQTLAASILAIDPAYSPDEERILTRRVKLDPAALSDRAAAREWSDPNGAADDWSQRAGAVRKLPSAGSYYPVAFDYIPGSALLLPKVVARAAVANAAVGDAYEARALLDEYGRLTPWTLKSHRPTSGGLRATPR